MKPNIRTLWLQAEEMFTSLADIANQCRKTANDLERNIMEMERMLGQLPKTTKPDSVDAVERAILGADRDPS